MLNGIIIFLLTIFNRYSHYNISSDDFVKIVSFFTIHVLGERV